MTLNVPISDQEFSQFQRFIYEAAGITLSPTKKALVTGRLQKRLQHHRLNSYRDYFKLLSSGESPAEVQTAVDLLTTNETYFFREPKHFEFLRKHLESKPPSGTFRAWSAASSSGEEAYSIAMLLADQLPNAPWEIVGTDISTRVLKRAQVGHYSMERARHVPEEYLKRFCLRGTGPQHGTLLIERKLRERVQFLHANLNEPMPSLGMFDVVFLRNVLIYFNLETKQRVVGRVLAQLKPGGHLFIGHSESLNDVSTLVRPLAPSIYVKD